MKNSRHGLNDTAKKWIMMVKEQMKKTEMRNLNGDETFFYKTKKDQLDGVCILRIDDILIMGSEEFHKETT